MKKKKAPTKIVRLTKVERHTLSVALRQYADAIYGTMDDSENKLFSHIHEKLKR